MPSTDPPTSSSPLDRRDFVKTSAAVVGAMSAAPFRPDIRPFHANDDTIRVGLVGCGGRGTGAAVQALSARQDVKLVAMADAFGDRLTQSLETIKSTEREEWLGGDVNIGAQVEVPPERQFVGFDAYQDVLPLVDVVILTTPPGFRPIHFAAAVAAGKHIFMEKPVATDAPGIRSVLETAELASYASAILSLGTCFETATTVMLSGSRPQSRAH